MKNLISQSSLSLPEGAVEKGTNWKQQSQGPLADDRHAADGQDLHLRRRRSEKAADRSKITLDTKVTLEPAADSNVAVKISSQRGQGRILVRQQGRPGRLLPRQRQAQDVDLDQRAGPRAVDRHRHHDDPGQARSRRTDPLPGRAASDDAVLLQLAEERAPGHAQQAGGLALVAPASSRASSSRWRS